MLWKSLNLGARPMDYMLCDRREDTEKRRGQRTFPGDLADQEGLVLHAGLYLMSTNDSMLCRASNLE